MSGSAWTSRTSAAASYGPTCVCCCRRCPRSCCGRAPDKQRICSPAERIRNFLGEEKMHAVVKNSALRKCAIFGVHVSPTTYSQAVDHAIKLAKQGTGGIFDFMSAHGLIMGARDEKFRR